MKGVIIGIKLEDGHLTQKRKYYASVVVQAWTLAGVEATAPQKGMTTMRREVVKL